MRRGPCLRHWRRGPLRHHTSPDTLFQAVPYAFLHRPKELCRFRLRPGRIERLQDEKDPPGAEPGIPQFVQEAGEGLGHIKKHLAHLAPLLLFIRRHQYKGIAGVAAGPYRHLHRGAALLAAPEDVDRAVLLRLPCCRLHEAVGASVRTKGIRTPDLHLPHLPNVWLSKRKEAPGVCPASPCHIHLLRAQCQAK